MEQAWASMRRWPQPCPTQRKGLARRALSGPNASCCRAGSCRTQALRAHSTAAKHHGTPGGTSRARCASCQAEGAFPRPPFTRPLLLACTSRFSRSERPPDNSRCRPSATHLLHSRTRACFDCAKQGCVPTRRECSMADDDQQSEDVRTCPNCGEAVVYRGVGRRPVWCSTGCRNDAALRRLGARKGAIEVRVVEIPRHLSGETSDPVSRGSSPQLPSADIGRRSASPPSPDQALRAIRNDPEAVGRLMSHLERRRADGTLLTAEWLPVRNALRLIASELPPGIERPT
jgi:hypothetical protein